MASYFALNMTMRVVLITTSATTIGDFIFLAEKVLTHGFNSHIFSHSVSSVPIFNRSLYSSSLLSDLAIISHPPRQLFFTNQTSYIFQRATAFSKQAAPPITSPILVYLYQSLQVFSGVVPSPSVTPSTDSCTEEEVRKGEIYLGEEN